MILKTNVYFLKKAKRRETNLKIETNIQTYKCSILIMLKTPLTKARLYVKTLLQSKVPSITICIYLFLVEKWILICFVRT